MGIDNKHTIPSREYIAMNNTVIYQWSNHFIPVCTFMLLIMPFSTAYHNLLSLMSQHSWHPVLIHLQSKTFCQSDRSVWHPDVIPGKIMVSYTLLSGHQMGRLTFPMLVTCPAHLILHDLIIHHQNFYWRFYHCGIWCHPTGQVVAEVLKNLGAFMFRVK